MLSNKMVRVLLLIISLLYFPSFGKASSQDDSNYLQNLLNHGGKIVLSKKSYYVTKPLVINKASTSLNGNGSVIYYQYSQKESNPTYKESLFVVQNANNVMISNVSLIYKGRFDYGTYKGMVSGIYVEGSDFFTADNVKASNFNRAGISLGIGTKSYNKNPIVRNCYLSNNRVAGCLYGNNSNGIIEKNVFESNGKSGDITTGYGFAGWSESKPVNTIVRYNKAINNFRKGIDFHSGQTGEIYNNQSIGNFICGIFVNNVSGSWKIYDNRISQMKSSNSKSPHMAGIEVGNRNRNGNRSEKISFNISNNTIEGFDNDKNITVAVPILIYTNNLGIGNINVSSNIVNAGNITNFVLTSPTGGKSYSQFYDLTVQQNEFYCKSLTSYPLYIRGNSARNIIVNNNKIEGLMGNAKLGYALYNEVSTVANNSIDFSGNIFQVPNMKVDSKKMIPQRSNVKQQNNKFKY